MMFNLPFEWMMLVLVLGAMGAFFVGQAMHGVMGDQGFGVIGNTVVLIAGFLIGLSGIDYLGERSLGLPEQVAIGLGTAFLALFVLAVLKRTVLRA